MKTEIIKNFLTDYLASLRERSRAEKGGPKWGIDWVIYNLGLALYGKPVRLPFLREGPEQIPKSKSEGEFGIDLAFVSEDGKELVIFVLKSERLSNSTWTTSKFDEDLRKAIYPDLDADGLANVEAVRVVLAYNRDEDQNGITLYERFVKNAPKTLARQIPLIIERWNLSALVDQTLKHVLSPALLPQEFFGQLNYLCAQFADFRHGSDPWEAQLVPAWKRFVNDALNHGTGLRGVTLVPIALIILRQHGEKNPSAETGWIDLIEWASIAMWRKFAGSADEDVRSAVYRFWNIFYIAELHRFYRTHIDALGTENAIDQIGMGSDFVGAVAAAVTAYWHLGRIGLLSMGLAQSGGGFDFQNKEASQILREIANWMVRVLNANESTRRPVLDIHHIEVYLVLAVLMNAGRAMDLDSVLRDLVQRLYLRRLGQSDLPFLDGGNSLENVFEQVATRPEEKLILTESSYFVQMLLEIACLFPEETRNELITQIHRRLVLGAYDTGEQKQLTPLHLMSWIPPENWEVKVLDGRVDDGDTVSLEPFSGELADNAEEIFSGVQNLIDQMRQAAPPPEDLKIPVAAAILASIRHQSPLPPELWRWIGFPTGEKNAKEPSQEPK